MGTRWYPGTSSPKGRTSSALGRGPRGLGQPVRIFYCFLSPNTLPLPRVSCFFFLAGGVWAPPVRSWGSHEAPLFLGLFSGVVPPFSGFRSPAPPERMNISSSPGSFPPRRGGLSSPDPEVPKPGSVPSAAGSSCRSLCVLCAHLPLISGLIFGQPAATLGPRLTLFPDSRSPPLCCRLTFSLNTTFSVFVHSAYCWPVCLVVVTESGVFVLSGFLDLGYVGFLERLCPLDSELAMFPLFVHP